MTFAAKMAGLTVLPDLINRLVSDIRGLQNGQQELRVKSLVSQGDATVQGSLVMGTTTAVDNTGAWVGSTISVSKIPSLDASKITSGVFAAGRIPDLSATYATKPSVSPQNQAQSTGTISSNTYRSGYVALTAGKKYLVLVSYMGTKDATAGNVALCVEAGSDTAFSTSYDLTVQQISGVAANSSFSLSGAYIVSATSGGFPGLTGTPAAVRCYVYTPGGTGFFTSLGSGSNAAISVVELPG